MSNTIRPYLRASTKMQDASRAKDQVEAFALSHGRDIDTAHWYIENESGATLERPELMRLLADSKRGDVILLEQIDRLSRLDSDDWDKLKAMLQDKGVVVVSIDLPTSYGLMADLTVTPKSNEEAFTQVMLKTINAMLMDMLGAMSRKDYNDRRHRQMQGIAKAQNEGKFKGRAPDLGRHALISKLLAADMSYTDIQNTLKGGVSRATIAKIAKASKPSEAL